MNSNYDTTNIQSDRQSSDCWNTRIKTDGRNWTTLHTKKLRETPLKPLEFVRLLILHTALGFVGIYIVACETVVLGGRGARGV